MAKDEFEPNYEQMIQIAQELQGPFWRIVKQGRIMPAEGLGGLALHLIMNARVAKLPIPILHKLIDILDAKMQVIAMNSGERTTNSGTPEEILDMMPPDLRVAAKRVEAALASGDAEDMQKALQALADLMGSAAALRKQEMDKADAKVREATERVIAKAAETIKDDDKEA
jgi:hypothetical protein